MKILITLVLSVLVVVGEVFPPFPTDTTPLDQTVIHFIQPHFVLPPPTGPTLGIRAIYVTNMCFLESNPLASEPSEGGSGSAMITTITYSGPAKNLWVAGLTNGTMLIECSTDLTNWFPFPSADMQLTFLPTNTNSIITDSHNEMYFRGKMK